tara:strand:- start:617 stop:1474 length:858 start_codon:yes stop_codon:yes gene_type:complete
MLDKYRIKGTINLDQNPCFGKNETFDNFQDELKRFKNFIIKSVDDESKSLTIYKFGDGDYYFLNQVAIGSASIGKRALSKNYSDIKHKEFVEGSKLCDHYSCEIYPENRKLFHEVISTTPDFPAEFGYGLVANKWLLKQFAGRIGLIGGKEKIDLVKKMMEHKEYQEYLGLEKFEDYLHVPQKFACDDIDETEKTIGEQLVNSKSRIFLLGVGHVKSALLHRLKKYKDAIFLDIGSGIDALAGIIDHNRPYMGQWTNYRVKDFNYDSLDILQYDIWNTPHKIIES